MVSGKWERQAQVAARLIRTNEILRVTDVEYQRQENACLGTADRLETDAVRLVLTDNRDTAVQYFDAVRRLAEAAIERGEKWIFTNVLFARCEALRLRAVASWAIENPDASHHASEALEAWTVLASTENAADWSRRNAHAIVALLAAFKGDRERASRTVAEASTLGSDEPFSSAWVELAALLRDSTARGEPVLNRWDKFFATKVVSSKDAELAGSGFNTGEACMLARIWATSNRWNLRPFETIRLLRGERGG